MCLKKQNKTKPTSPKKEKKKQLGPLKQHLLLSKYKSLCDAFVCWDCCTWCIRKPKLKELSKYKSIGLILG